jgi:hypothetical protein
MSNIYQFQVCPIVRSESPEYVTRSVPVCRLSHQPGTFGTSRALIFGSSYVTRMRVTANPGVTCGSCSVVFPHNAFHTTHNCKTMSLCILSLYSSLFGTYKQGVCVCVCVCVFFFTDRHPLETDIHIAATNTPNAVKA